MQHNRRIHIYSSHYDLDEPIGRQRENERMQIRRGQASSIKELQSTNAVANVKSTSQRLHSIPVANVNTRMKSAHLCIGAGLTMWQMHGKCHGPHASGGRRK